MSLSRRSFIHASSAAAAVAAAAESANAVAQTASPAAAASPSLGEASSLGFRQLAAGSVQRSVQDKLTERISVFDFMSPAQIVDVRSRKLQLDVTAAVQAAVAASSGGALYFPNGKYLVSRKISLPASIQMLGENARQTLIQGSAGNAIFEFPSAATRCSIRGLSFTGADAIGITVASGSGALHDYLIEFTMEDCHFSWNMRVGLLADLIFGQIKSCSFGSFGDGPAGSSLVGVKCYGNGTNYTNVNFVGHCNFQHCNPTSFAVDIMKGGSNWVFSFCNFDSGGRCVRLDNISLVRFDNCWFEGNGSADYLVLIGASESNTEFNLCSFVNNRAPYLVQYSSSATHGLSFQNCSFGIAGNGYIIYDEVTKSTNLLGNGSVVFKDVKVSGGNAAHRITSTLNRGSVNEVRAWVIVNTAGNGAIVAASDATIRAVTRNGPGDVSIAFPYPLASTLSNVCCVATGTTCSVNAFAQGSTQNVRIQAFGRGGANAPTDDTVKLIVLGT